MAFRSNKGRTGRTRRTGRSTSRGVRRGVSQRGQTVKLVIEHVQAGQSQLPAGPLQTAISARKAKL